VAVHSGLQAAVCVRERSSVALTMCMCARAVTTALDAALVHAHDVVVLVGHARAVAEQVSAWCRSRAGEAGAARLTWCGIMGLFGFVYNDFGAEFHVSDTTGENPVKRVVDVCCGCGDSCLRWRACSERLSLATSCAVSSRLCHASMMNASTLRLECDCRGGAF
jgi:hypothetical protein